MMKPDTTRPPINLADYEACAQGKLEPSAWAYFSGGAGDEHTLAENVRAWREIALMPRVLRDLAPLSTRCQVLGRDFSHPIMVAPFAYQSMLDPKGEIACAYASAVLNAGFTLSAQSSCLLEDVAKAFLSEPDRGPLWHQLYWVADRGWMQEHLLRIERAGFEAIVLTVDAPVHGVRDQERRSDFKLPRGIRAVNLPANQQSSLALTKADNLADPFIDLLARSARWEDVNWLCQQTRLPILLKGILHPSDAKQGVDAGCRGIIVSNHGGRTLDTAISTSVALPRIRDAIGQQPAVLVDGGIRRGTDILKAMALGADAVMIARPIAYALACAGMEGVAHAIRLLWDELKVAMALTGSVNLRSIEKDLLQTSFFHLTPEAPRSQP